MYSTNNMKDLNFPICFRHKKSQMIYGYLENGFCLVAHESRAIIFLSEFHGRCSTFEMYTEYMNELKADKIHNEITAENFDKTLSKAFDNIFVYTETDILNVTLKGVQKRRIETFGFYAEQSKTN